VLAQDDDVIVGVELPKLYTGGIYVHYGNTYESVHKPKETSVKTPKKQGRAKNQDVVGVLLTTPKNQKSCSVCNKENVRMLGFNKRTHIDNPYEDCCYREPDEIKENKISDLELYQMMLFGVISSIADNFPDLLKNKIPKIPVIKEEPDVEKIEVEFPELNVVEKMVGVTIGTIQPINFDLARERQYGNNWDQVIQYFDWKRVSTNPQITYQYTQNILIINKIIPYKKEEDVIVKRLNYARWMFQQIHEDDNYFQYKNKTEEYLAVIFAEWIKINVVSGTDLPPGIPDTIARA
ncbi:13670_t:CDS:2, partial [Racocetra persica]